MINVLLDTNIYTRNPRRSNLDFDVLKMLSKANKVTLYVPHMVEREFQSQQFLKSKRHLDSIKTNLEDMIRNNLTGDSGFIHKFIGELDEQYPSILAESEQIFKSWLDSCNAKRFPISLEQTHQAWEAYFKGELPFSEPKSRKDIPDSFIVQSIREILKDIDYLYLISDDGNVLKSFESDKKIGLFNSLSEFIQHDVIQNQLKILDPVEGLDIIQKALETSEKEMHSLEYYIQSNLGDKVLDEEIENDAIPDDNHVATISGFYEPEDIKLDMTNLLYYGNGLVGFNFVAKLRVSIYYYIYKADYYCMEDEISPSVTDHNDHYFEAEDDCEIQVTGTITILIDYNEVFTTEVDDLEFEGNTIEVEKIAFSGW